MSQQPHNPNNPPPVAFGCLQIKEDGKNYFLAYDKNARRFTPNYCHTDIFQEAHIFQIPSDAENSQELTEIGEFISNYYPNAETRLTVFYLTPPPPIETSGINLITPKS